jgi:hypothetical protein
MVFNIIANFVLIAALVACGLQLFASYHKQHGQARTVTSLLAGLGLLMLASAILVTPTTSTVLVLLSSTVVPWILLVASSTFLIAAIVAFGVINYWNPLRLQHEGGIRKRARRSHDSAA